MHSMGRARKSGTNPRSVAAKNEQSTVRFVPVALGALEDCMRQPKNRLLPLKNLRLPVKKEAAN
jgi:hypothetical protein